VIRPVQHDGIRQLQRRTDQAERQGWVDHHEAGTDLGRQVVGRRTIAGCGRPGSRTRSTRNGCRASCSSAPS
jgi:hypothetical protein